MGKSSSWFEVLEKTYYSESLSCAFCICEVIPIAKKTEFEKIILYNCSRQRLIMSNFLQNIMNYKLGPQNALPIIDCTIFLLKLRTLSNFVKIKASQNVLGLPVVKAESGSSSVYL